MFLTYLEITYDFLKHKNLTKAAWISNDWISNIKSNVPCPRYISHSIHAQDNLVIFMFIWFLLLLETHERILFLFLFCGGGDPPQNESSLCALENEQASCAKASTYRHCTDELSRDWWAPKVWGGGGCGNRNGERTVLHWAWGWRRSLCSLLVPGNCRKEAPSLCLPWKKWSHLLLTASGGYKEHLYKEHLCSTGNKWISRRSG